METVVPTEFVGLRSAILDHFRPLLQANLARAVLARFDYRAVSAETLFEFDDPVKRLEAYLPAKIDIAEIAAELVQSNAIRSSLKYRSEKDLPSRKKAKERLTQWLQDNSIELALSTISLDTDDNLWRSMADEMEQELLRSQQLPEEWELHNRLLLIEFLRNCRLNRARLVQHQLKSLTAPILSVRGTLTRIPETIPHEYPAVQPVLEPTAPPTHAHSSMLYQAAMQAATDIDVGQGVLQRIAGDRTGRWLDGIPSQLVDVIIEGRKRTFAMHEATASAMLFAAAGEQLIRSHAERNSIVQFTNSRPRPALEVAKKLRESELISSGAMSAAAALFGTDAINLRNRASHGALVDTEAKWLESVLDHNNENMPLPPLPWNETGSSPYGIAKYAKELFFVLANEIEIDPSEFADWTSQFRLANAIELGGQLRNDLLHTISEAVVRADQVHQLLNAVIPVVDTYFRVATITWLQDATPLETGRTGFVLGQYFAMTVFETLYRAVAQMMGFSILQINSQASRLNVRYRVLGSDGSGIGRDEVVEAIVRPIAEQRRELAVRVLRAAIDIRDAAAHGAITTQNAEEVAALGNIVWAALQILCHAIEWHLTREAAYFNYANRPSTGQADAVQDWLAAQRSVDNLIRHHDESPRKYRALRAFGIVIPGDFSSYEL